MEHKFLKKETSLYNIRYIIEYSFRKEDGSRSRKVSTFYHYKEGLKELVKEEFLKTKGRKLKSLIIENIKNEKV